MLNFTKPTRSRRNSHAAKTYSRRLQLEHLETRTVLAATPTAVFDVETGTLQLKGTQVDDVLKLGANAEGEIEVRYNGAPLGIDLPGGPGNGCTGNSCPTVDNLVAVDASFKQGNDLFVLCRDERMRFSLTAKGGLGDDRIQLIGTAKGEILHLQSTKQGRSPGYLFSQTDKPQLGQVPGVVIGEANSVEFIAANMLDGNDHAVLVVETAINAVGQGGVVLYLGVGSDTADISYGVPSIVDPEWQWHVTADGEEGVDIINVVARGDAGGELIVKGGPQSDIIGLHIEEASNLRATLDGGDALSRDMLVRSSPTGVYSQDFGTHFEVVFDLTSEQPVVAFDATGDNVQMDGLMGISTLVHENSPPQVFQVTSLHMQLTSDENGSRFTDYAIVYLQDPPGVQSGTGLSLGDALNLLLVGVGDG